MDSLQDLWRKITITTLVDNTQTVAETFHRCDDLLRKGMFQFRHISKEEAGKLRIDHARNVLRSKSVPGERIEAYAVLIFETTQIIHISPDSALDLIKELTSTSSMFQNLLPNVPDLIHHFYGRRKFILAILRYMFEATRPFEHSAAHPYEVMFSDYLEIMKSKEFCSALLGEYDIVLKRLKAHVEMPQTLLASPAVLSLILQDARELFIMLFDIVGHLPKDRLTLEKVVGTLIGCGEHLQRFPVSMTGSENVIQMTLLQQINEVLTAFFFRFVNVGAPLFLRDTSVKRYLDDLLLTGPALAVASPSCVLWCTCRLEEEMGSAKLLGTLGNLLAEFNPFVLLSCIIKSASFGADSMSLFVSLVYDWVDQFILVTGIDLIEGLMDSIAELAAVVFGSPCEAARFWSRWSESKGENANFGWGQFLQALLMDLPNSWFRLTTVFAPVLKCFSSNLQTNSTYIRSINELLWNMECIVEEVSENDIRTLTVTRRESADVTIVRTERDRSPNQNAIVTIPAGTFGVLRRSPECMFVRWTLPEQYRFSLWTLCSVHLESRLLRWKENTQDSLKVLDRTAQLYTASVSSDSRLHEDLNMIFTLICRLCGCLIQGYLDWNMDSSEKPDIMLLISIVTDLTAVESCFRGLEFLSDMAFIIPIFPQARNTEATSVEWIRNVDLSWYGTFWTYLRSQLGEKDLSICMDKLASCLTSYVKEKPVAVQSQDRLLLTSSLMLLNIGLPQIAKLNNPPQGSGILKFVRTLLIAREAVDSPPNSVAAILSDSILEGQCGQGLLLLVQNISEILGRFVQQPIFLRSEDVNGVDSVVFVHKILKVFSSFLDQISLTAVDKLSSFERTLLSGHRNPKETMTIVSRARNPIVSVAHCIMEPVDSDLVILSTTALTRIVTAYQPSLLTVLAGQMDRFLSSSARLLRDNNKEMSEKLWRFYAVCDATQPRLLDLFINLESRSDGSFVKDVQDRTSILEIVMDLVQNRGPEAVAGPLEFALRLLTSKNEYVDYFSTRLTFWTSAFRALELVTTIERPWTEKKAAAHVCDLVSTQLQSYPSSATLLSAEYVDGLWTNYFLETIPKFFPYFNKHIPKLLSSLEEEPEQLAALTAFFTSWCRMNAVIVTKPSIRDLFIPDIQRDVVRTLVVLLNRCLVRSFKTDFVRAVAEYLYDAFAIYEEAMTAEFLLTLLHIIEEFTDLVCGKDTYMEWNDSARLAVLRIATRFLELMKRKEAAASDNLERMFWSAVDVICVGEAEWKPSLTGEGDLKGESIGMAAEVLTYCALLGRNVDEKEDELAESRCYEVLTVKAAEIIQHQKAANVGRKLFGFLELCSRSMVGAEKLIRLGFTAKMKEPLVIVAAWLKQGDIERNDTVAVVSGGEGRRSEKEALEEMYIMALDIQFNLLRAERQRSATALKFLLSQITAFKELLSGREDSAPATILRIAECLARLTNEAYEPGLSRATRQTMVQAAATIYHLMCSQLIKKSDDLIDDLDELEKAPWTVVLSAMINCLRVLNRACPPIEEIIAVDDQKLRSGEMVFFVEYDFSSPVSVSLSPSLSFGTLTHMTRTGLQILSRETSQHLYNIVFSQDRNDYEDALRKLLDCVEQSAYFLLKQAVAFAAGYSDLSGERWEETLQELNSELVDIRHQIRDFVQAAIETAPSLTADRADRPKTFLELLVEDMISFRTYFDDISPFEQYDAVPARVSISLTPSGPLKATDRKRVTFNLR